MGRWWCGPITETAGVGDKGPGNLGVSQRRREGPGVRTGEAGPGGLRPTHPLSRLAQPHCPGPGHGPSRWSRHPSGVWEAPWRTLGCPELGSQGHGPSTSD